MTFEKIRLIVKSSVIAISFGLLLVAQNVSAETVLRVIPHADLKNLDPIWTTAYISRNHGYMIYDTLFAMDEDFKPQPQMVDTWETSSDGKVWTFVLRDGLKFHDGSPVTGDDVVASLQRWGKKDGKGQQLFNVVDKLESPSQNTIVMTLTEPYSTVLETLGKISSNVPFIMPKRVAETDPEEQITDYTGSGPFKFEEDEWVPGDKVVYTKFEEYVPRDEPASAASGGKIAKVDKVIWQYFPDSNTAMNALLANEVDYFEAPQADFVPILEQNEDILVEIHDPIGFVGFSRFNHLLPPFDDVEIRKAAIMAMKQEDYLISAVGDPKYWSTCYSVFPCGTPYENDAGSEIMEVGDINAAKKALEETDYDGTEIVIIHPTDIPVLAAFSQVSVDKLRRAGFKIDQQSMDWSTLTSRRANRGPVEEGGWNIFHTAWNGVDIIDPSAIAFSGNPESGWFGWADDAELETFRNQFSKETNVDKKKELAAKVQARLWEIGASGQLGQYFNPVAYRNNVKGVIKSPIQFFWNISVE